MRGGGGGCAIAERKRSKPEGEEKKTRERTGDNTQQVIYLWSGQGYEKHRV